MFKKNVLHYVMQVINNKPIFASSGSLLPLNSKLIEIGFQKKNVEEALGIFEKRNSQITLDESSYMIGIKLYCSAKRYMKADELIKKIHQKNFLVNAYHFNYLLLNFIKMSNREKFNEYLKYYEDNSNFLLLKKK